jgi:hypothetical protein
VNNLNLIVEDPSGHRIVGNQGASLDSWNNVEVVQMDRPATGTWRVTVVGSNVPHGPQDFALVFRGHLGRS